MIAWPARSMPKTLRYCSICHKETTHEILENGGPASLVCVPCREETLSYELDRE